VAEAIRRYLDAVADEPPAVKSLTLAADEHGLSADEVHALANRIADETV